MWTETYARRLRVKYPGLVHCRDVRVSRAGPECGKGGSDLPRLCPAAELRCRIHPAGTGLQYNLLLTQTDVTFKLHAHAHV